MFMFFSLYIYILVCHFIVYILLCLAYDTEIYFKNIFKKKHNIKT